jgi:hypothetical protein
VFILTTRPLYPQGKSPWYPLDMRLGGPQSRCGCGGEENESHRCPCRKSKPGRPAHSQYIDGRSCKARDVSENESCGRTDMHDNPNISSGFVLSVCYTGEAKNCFMKSLIHTVSVRYETNLSHENSKLSLYNCCPLNSALL